jgi:hypothetical protein
MQITYKDYLREKYDAVNEVRTEKRKHIDELRSIQDKLDKIEADRQALKKSLHKDH